MKFPLCPICYTGGIDAKLIIAWIPEITTKKEKGYALTLCPRCGHVEYDPTIKRTFKNGDSDEDNKEK